MLTATLRFDGASRGNPGKAASAAVLHSAGGSIYKCAYMAHALPQTCNVAEYLGLIAGLRLAAEMGVRTLIVEGDSKLVIEQVFGNWECRHPRLRALCSLARQLKTAFETVDGRWIPRERNGEADALCNRALDALCNRAPDALGACEGDASLFAYSAGASCGPPPLPVKPSVFIKACEHRKRPYTKKNAPSILEQLGLGLG